MSFIEGPDRAQVSLLPPSIEDYIAPAALVRVVDAFVDSLDLSALGFERTLAAATGRPGFRPGDMLRLYIWGYLNQVRSSRMLERACTRDLEALWLMRRLAPDYRTIAAFRHDNPDAIVRTSAAFVQFCREQGLICGRMVALDGTKMRAVASPKNIAGAERLARDIAHTEREIAYYLDRLDVMDEHMAKGFGDQPAHREAFGAAIASLERRKDRLAKRQVELDQRDEKVLVFGEPEAKPMGYGHAPKLPAYNLQSVVDVESGLIVHHDVCNDANDSHMLHRMSVAAKKVLEADELHVLTDGGYSNAAEVARCEAEAITVSAPIKRGAMNSEHFRPTQFHLRRDERHDPLSRRPEPAPLGQAHTQPRGPLPDVRLQGLSAEDAMHARRSADHPSADRPRRPRSDGAAHLRRSQPDEDQAMHRRAPVRHDKANVRRRQVSDARAK